MVILAQCYLGAHVLIYLYFVREKRGIYEWLDALWYAIYDYWGQHVAHML